MLVLPALAAPPKMNLVKNGSFERTTARWAGWHAKIRAVRIPHAPGGRRVVHVALRGAHSAFAVQTAGPRFSAPRRRGAYVAAAVVRAASVGSVGKPVTLRLRAFKGGKLLRIWRARNLLSATFQPMHVRVEIGGRRVRFDLRLTQTNAGHGDAFLADRVRLVPGAAYVEGPSTAKPGRQAAPRSGGAATLVQPVAPAYGLLPVIGGLTSFRGDWETGDISQWSGTSCVAADRLQIVTNPVRQGRYAARFEVRPGDKPSSSGERCEVYRSPKGDESPGQAYYYAWSTMVPVGWQNPKGFGLFLQFHTPWPTNPALELSTQFGELYIFTRGGDINHRDARRTTILPSLSPGLWNDFIMYVKWGVTDGAVKIWHRVQGQSQFSVVFDQTNVPDVMTQNGVPGKNYLRWGYYRGDGSPGTAVVYQDGMRRGPTYADVAADFPPS